MNSPAVDVIGRTIAGRYRLLRLVGEGGVGRVYEAEQILGSSQRAVAVKLLRPEWSQDAAVVARFQREAALVARLQHPNTVRIYDFGATEDGTLFLAMEFLRGRSLQHLLDAEGALPPDRVRSIIRQVAGSLQEAHDLGIVHRDLKPDNILIQDVQAPGSGGAPDVVKLVDFGIAKGQASSGSAYTKLTALGTFVGTPAYMSPEQFGGGNVGPASDVYSLGVTSHYMLSGHLPFSGETAVEWARAHLSMPAPLLEQDAGKGPIPEVMRQAVARALSKEPAERPASAAQFASEFSGGAAAVPVAPAAAAVAPVAPAAPAAVPVAVAPPTAALPGGGPHTAPMTRVPDFAALGREGTAVATTVSIPAPPPPVVPLPGAAPRPARAGSRRVLWLLPLLLGVGAAGFALFQYSGQRVGFWPVTAEPVSPDELKELGIGGAGEPAPVVIEPDPIPSLPAAPRPESKPSAPVSRAPSPPKPAPAGSKPAPSLPVPLPGVPLPGAPPIATGTGGAGGGPNVPPPATAPSVPGIPGIPGLPLPFPMPSQGACQRCLDALEAGGHASVVKAMAQDLLCDDQGARFRCETRVREVAPDVAEQAARAGDCPSALATMAAAVHLGVEPTRFSVVNATCVR